MYKKKTAFTFALASFIGVLGSDNSHIIGMDSLFGSEVVLDAQMHSRYDSSQILAAVTPRKANQQRQEVTEQPSSRSSSNQSLAEVYEGALKTIVDLSGRLSLAESKAANAQNTLALEKKYDKALVIIKKLQSKVIQLQKVEKNNLANQKTIKRLQDKFREQKTTEMDPFIALQNNYALRNRTENSQIIESDNLSALQEINILQKKVDQLRTVEFDYFVALQNMNALHNKVERLKSIEVDYLAAQELNQALQKRLNQQEQLQAIPFDHIVALQTIEVLSEQIKMITYANSMKFEEDRRLSKTPKALSLSYFFNSYERALQNMFSSSSSEENDPQVKMKQNEKARTRHFDFVQL